MNIDAGTVINAVITAVLTIAGLMGAHKAGWFEWLKKEAPLIEEGAQEVGHLVSEAVKAPVFAGLEAELRHKVNAMESNFQKSELGRLAAVGLHAFGDALGNLSPTQKTALVQFIKQNLPKDAQVTEADILKAVQSAQNLADEAAKSSLFNHANLFTEALAAPPQVAPADPTPTDQAQQTPQQSA